MRHWDFGISFGPPAILFFFGVYFYLSGRREQKMQRGQSGATDGSNEKPSDWTVSFNGGTEIGAMSGPNNDFVRPYHTVRVNRARFSNISKVHTRPLDVYLRICRRDDSGVVTRMTTYAEVRDRPHLPAHTDASDAILFPLDLAPLSTTSGTIYFRIPYDLVESEDKANAFPYDWHLQGARFVCVDQLSGKTREIVVGEQYDAESGGVRDDSKRTDILPPCDPAFRHAIGIVRMSVQARNLDTEPSIRLVVALFNGTGEPLTLKEVSGYVEVNGGRNRSTPAGQLRPFFFVGLRQNEFYAGEFEFAVEADIPKGFAEKLRNLPEGQAYDLQFDALRITIQSATVPSNRTSAPLWDAISLTRDDRGRLLSNRVKYLR